MKTFFKRLIERVLDGPRCPDCPDHDARTHSHNGCQSAVYDRHGLHAGWCDCKTPYGGRKPNRIERETAEAVSRG